MVQPNNLEIFLSYSELTLFLTHQVLRVFVSLPQENSKRRTHLTGWASTSTRQSFPFDQYP